MALFNPNPSAIASQIGATAAGKAAQAVSQAMSPKLVQDVQRVLKLGNLVGNTLGMKTGIGVIDNLFSLGSGSDAATPLLGGLTMSQAKAIYEQVKAARVQKKNLFFLRVTDENPPVGAYQSGGGAGGGGGGLGGLIASKIGPAIGSISAGISGAVGSIAGSAAGKVAGNLANSAAGGVLGAMGVPGMGASNSIGGMALATFDLLALDVSYGPSLISDHVQVGSGFIDRPTGRTPTELQITTMDDEAGTLKRWFNGKMDQVALPDGTFGLPWEYLVTIEIVHAIPSEQVAGFDLAYSKTLRLRPQSIQVDLSRREQAVAEQSFVFSQFDSFMGL